MTKNKKSCQRFSQYYPTSAHTRIQRMGWCLQNPPGKSQVLQIPIGILVCIPIHPLHRSIWIPSVKHKNKKKIVRTFVSLTLPSTCPCHDPEEKVSPDPTWKSHKYSRFPVSKKILVRTPCHPLVGLPPL